MKTFNIDIESVLAMEYRSGMAKINAKVTLTEDSTTGRDFSELHMSEASLRRIHEALGKFIANREKYGEISFTVDFP